MSEEKALDKIDIKSELKVLSPIEARSIELKEQAEAITIEDKPSYQEAKKVKRELVTHRTTTKNLRLTFTRKLDSAEEFIIVRIEQEEERKKIQQERIKLHSEQLAAINFPLNETIFGFRISGLDLTKSDDEWQPIYEQAKKRLAMQAEKDAKPADEPINTSYPGTTATPAAEPAKETSAPVKESEPVPSDVQGGMDALVTKPEAPADVKFWYVVTEEGIEGTGKESPLEALIEYLYLGEDTEERVDEILKGDTEINHVAQYTREELAAMPEV